MFQYLAPFSADLCDIRPLLFESGEGVGPFAARGIGEIPISGPLGAIPAAVASAIGAHVDRLPVTPERVLAALASRLGS
jgi:CO/xanthine dehydrogenase Mo-binding subunit